MKEMSVNHQIMISSINIEILSKRLFYLGLVSALTQPFQNIFPVTDIAIYRLNQLRGQSSENHLKCITRWKGRDGVTITSFVQHTMDGHKTPFL